MPKPEDDRKEPLMTIKEVCDYLKVKPKSIYRWLRQGTFPGIRVGGQWRFYRKDVEQYLANKKFQYYSYAIGHCFFAPDVLNKYRTSARRYYLIEQAYDGRVGAYLDHYEKHRSASTQKPLPPNTMSFVDIHFRKVTLRNGSLAIVLTPQQHKNLPNEEQSHWAGYRIIHPDI